MLKPSKVYSISKEVINETFNSLLNEIPEQMKEKAKTDKELFLLAYNPIFNLGREEFLLVKNFINKEEKLSVIVEEIDNNNLLNTIQFFISTIFFYLEEGEKEKESISKFLTEMDNRMTDKYLPLTEKIYLDNMLEDMQEGVTLIIGEKQDYSKGIELIYPLFLYVAYGLKSNEN